MSLCLTFSDLAWSQDYVYRDSQLLATARVDGVGETYHHFHLNHLGTPLLITDEDGDTEALHSYFPFGEEITASTDGERMKYTGHERDVHQEGQADDLDYMHARYCSPLLGRFLSVDPSTGSANPRMPQTWNRYSYVFNGPLVSTDPTGREATLTIDEEEGTLTITAEIDIWGEEATDEIAQEIETSIESGWSNQTYVDPESGTVYQVVVDVEVRNVGARKRDATARNRIKIDSNVQDGRDRVSSAGRVDTGIWKPDSWPPTRAHEFGHLVGLDDDFSRRTGKPKPGHSGHLMAGGGTTWSLAPHEVRDVVDKPLAQYHRSGKSAFRLH